MTFFVRSFHFSFRKQRFHVDSFYLLLSISHLALVHFRCLPRVRRIIRHLFYPVTHHSLTLFKPTGFIFTLEVGPKRRRGRCEFAIHFFQFRGCLCRVAAALALPPRSGPGSFLHVDPLRVARPEVQLIDAT